jgi:SPP1 gp7 family putative phage head morphogenesis protein
VRNLDLAYLFNLPPEKAIEYLAEKGYAITFDWHEMLDADHAQEFTVAKAMRLEVLQDIHEAVIKALKDGQTLETFQRQLMPELKRMGWWGRQEVLNPATGELRMAQLGSPYRLQTIYQANLQTSYMSGRWKGQWENRENRPYLMYVAVLDSRTRPAHRALHGTIARIDSPFWRYFYPPNGWRCRCRVRALTHDEAVNMVKNGQGVWVKDDALSFKEVAIPGTAGETGTVAVYQGTNDMGQSIAVSPDLGWSYNPGMARWQPDLAKYAPEIKALW